MIPTPCPVHALVLRSRANLSRQVRRDLQIASVDIATAPGASRAVCTYSFIRRSLSLTHTNSRDG
jgi:hypothetical protein